MTLPFVNFCLCCPTGGGPPQCIYGVLVIADWEWGDFGSGFVTNPGDATSFKMTSPVLNNSANPLVVAPPINTQFTYNETPGISSTPTIQPTIMAGPCPTLTYPSPQTFTFTLTLPGLTPGSGADGTIQFILNNGSGSSVVVTDPISGTNIVPPSGTFNSTPLGSVTSGVPLTLSWTVACACYCCPGVVLGSSYTLTCISVVGTPPAGYALAPGNTYSLSGGPFEWDATIGTGAFALLCDPTRSTTGGWAFTLDTYASPGDGGFTSVQCSSPFMLALTIDFGGGNSATFTVS